MRTCKHIHTCESVHTQACWFDAKSSQGQRTEFCPSKDETVDFSLNSGDVTEDCFSFSYRSSLPPHHVFHNKNACLRGATPSNGLHPCDLGGLADGARESSRAIGMEWHTFFQSSILPPSLAFSCPSLCLSRPRPSASFKLFPQQLVKEGWALESWDAEASGPVTFLKENSPGPWGTLKGKHAASCRLPSRG